MSPVRMQTTPRAAVALCMTLAALTYTGCLFNDAPPPRYFAPPSAITDDHDPPVNVHAGHAVRLRRVQSAAYIGEQIVWRGSDVERGLYEQRRWTEFPSRYL